VILSEQYKNDIKIGSSKITYDNSSLTSQLTKPVQIEVSKGDDVFEGITKINRYDSFGNVLESENIGGTQTSFVWGFNSQYPMARIDNATYDDVLSSGVDLSILNSYSSTDQQKIDELDKIRTNVNGALVTTYTFKPLIGMTSQTDPRGYTMYYEYDDLNRLEYVKDGEGNILSKNEYNYRTNN